MKSSDTLVPMAGSVFCFLYLSMLIALAHCHIEISGFARVIFELITIPTLLMAVFLSFFSLRQWQRENWRVQSRALLSFTILCLLWLLVIWATFLI
jgi:hypothetical protein